MPRFNVTFCGREILKVWAGLTVEADTPEQARAQVKQLDDDGELEFDWTDDKILEKDLELIEVTEAPNWEPNPARKTDSDDQPCTHLNHYMCDRCLKAWSDAWTGEIEDDCPRCSMTMMPYQSVVKQVE